MSIKKLFLSIISLILTIVILEIMLHFFIKPSDFSFGTIFGRELPPRYIIPQSNIEEALKRFDIVSTTIAKREDPVLGLTNKENATSADGTRRINNLGAKSNGNTDSEKTPGVKRILFFGDSFAEGDKLPPEKTFQHIMNLKDEKIEALNFGVGGYSTGQAYLRFKSLKNKLEYDTVILVVVPYEGRWRDINVSRYLGESWTRWGLMMNPRFVIKADNLEVVTSPYKSMRELAHENKDTISPRLLSHLKKYDAFYYGCLYDPQTSLLDYSIIYKLLRLKYCNLFVVKKNRNDLLNPESESMKITKMIVEEMGEEVESDGAEFAVILLPVGYEIEEYRSNSNDYRVLWDTMSEFICSSKFPCYDLMHDFQKVPHDSIDYSDGSHYGHRANKYIAEFILNRLDNSAPH